MAFLLKTLVHSQQTHVLAVAWFIFSVLFLFVCICICVFVISSVFVIFAMNLPNYFSAGNRPLSGLLPVDLYPYVLARSTTTCHSTGWWGAFEKLFCE